MGQPQQATAFVARCGQRNAGQTHSMEYAHVGQPKALAMLAEG